MSQLQSTRGQFAISVVLLIVAIAGIVLLRLPRQPAELIAEARLAIEEARFAEARQLAEDCLKQDPQNADALMVAAIAAAEQGQFEEAAAYCSRVGSDAGPTASSAHSMAGNLYLNQLHRPRDAEKAFRQAVDVDPSNVVALERLAYLLSLQTRTWELVPLQLRRIRRDSVTPNLVLSLVHSELLYPDAELIQKLRSESPDYAGWSLAESRLAILKRDFQSAKRLVREALKSDPELTEAYVRLGQILLEVGSPEEQAQWRADLPQAALSFPDTWLTLGQLALQIDDITGAARCFQEAGMRDAASRQACYLLGRQLAALGRDDQAQPFLHRARELERYRKLFDHGAHTPVQMTIERLMAGVELSESLGLIWEAYAFANLARQTSPQTSSAEHAMGALRSRLTNLPLERTAPAANQFRDLDLPEYNWSESIARPGTGAPASHDVPASEIHFENVASEVGIDFRFDNGVDRSISGAQRPYDFTGGGIAAIDFDVDGWPDLYFTQGCTLNDATGEPVRGSPDQLYRNKQGRTFQGVSLLGLPSDVDYSQGVAAGDFNNDGFADLFVANLGANRLLVNNGDGTFSDVSTAIQDNADQWTTSCLICDLNGDSWPDLYSVNYLSGDIVSRICRDESGRRNPCAPQTFPAAQDQLHLGDGTGKFIEATQTSGIQIPNGKGLGIVTADFNGDRQLDLFVANDGVPNFLFERVADGETLYQDVAMQRGVAVNLNGLSEASMGIVVEDLDGDLRTDILVTNFLDETNTLYQGSDLSGFFDDATRMSGLGPSSVSMLAFGVQAIDGELDGRPDLLIANGHVDDFSDRDVPYQMQPQYFRNLGSLQFAEQPADILGAFFTKKCLGRSVTRLDWDNDGDEDVAVGILDAPSALLRNSTGSQGSWVSFDLRAVASQRDAIGTIVSVTTATGKRIQRQLIAGDGYQCSNQRTLVFGLADEASPVNVEIAWPDGRTRAYTKIAPGHRYLAAQPNTNLFRMPELSRP